MIVAQFFSTLALLIWHMIWPLAFGFALSALIRSYVPGESIIRRLGKNNLSSAFLATVFGAASSVCNYATVGMGHTLRLKGASWQNTLTFMIASTNLGITMIIAVYGFLGPVFLKVMMAAALMFLVLSYFLGILFGMPPPETPDRAGEMSMADGTQWQQACDYFRSDFDMTRKDILVGFVVASAVGAFIPASWWEVIFWSYQDHGAMSWLWNAMVGVVVTIVTFGCSIGNVSLAAVMWWNGVSAGGVMAFLLACLLTFPMFKVTVGYYGLKTTIKSTLVLSLGVILSCLIIDWLIREVPVHLVRMSPIAMKSEVGLMVTVVLNVLLGVLGIAMYRKGRGMMGDM